MGSGPPDGTLGEDELRAVICLQIVIDSARAAGLEVASPIPSESGDCLLVYGGATTDARRSVRDDYGCGRSTVDSRRLRSWDRCRPGSCWRWWSGVGSTKGMRCSCSRRKTLTA